RHLHSFPTRRSSDLFDMNRRFGFSIFWTLLVFLIIGAVAAIAYHAGATVAVGNSGAAGVDPRYYYPGWGLFGLFPLLFFILILLDRKSTRLNSSHLV